MQDAPVTSIMTVQRGAMMLEVLIGILLFSAGILALVGMQSFAIKQMVAAKYRVDASFLANRLLGEMWVNRADLTSYAYGGSGTPPAPLTHWATSIQNTLPGVTGTTNLPVVAIAGNRVTITIFWQPPASDRSNYMTIALISDP